MDVGGGVGAASLPIVRNYPNIRLVIQDAEPVVAEAPKVILQLFMALTKLNLFLLKFWMSHYPEAVKEGRVSFQGRC